MRYLPLVMALGLSQGIGDLWNKAAQADQVEGQDNFAHALLQRSPNYSPHEQDVFSFLAQNTGQATWEPIARIEEPQFPIKIELVNRSGLVLDYGFTNDPLAVPATLSPEGTAVLELINPETLLSVNPSQPDETQDTPLEFDVTVEANDAVRIEVYQARSYPDLDGDAIGLVIDIQKSGGIFIY